MGHIRLGTLPNTRPWRHVVGRIADGESVAAVAAATSAAATDGLARARADAGLARVVFLLARTVLAARDDDFARALAAVGVRVPPDPGLFDLTAAVTAAARAWHVATGTPRTDLGEIAELAAAETLARCLGERSAGLFPTGGEVRAAAREFSTPNGFAHLAHEFYSRFTQRFLLYHLERELPLHVGGAGRFADTAAHAAFVDELDVHSREAARVVRTYAGEWYGKARFEAGIDDRQAARFSRTCLSKLAHELAVRGGLHG